MKMIRREDIGVNLSARLGANLAQRLNEALAIRIIHGDPFAPVTAIHDVINPASLLDSQLAGHDGGVALIALMCQYQELTPLLTLSAGWRALEIWGKRQRIFTLLRKTWCRGRDSNPHGLSAWGF